MTEPRDYQRMKPIISQTLINQGYWAEQYRFGVPIVVRSSICDIDFPVQSEASSTTRDHLPTNTFINANWLWPLSRTISLPGSYCCLIIDARYWFFMSNPKRPPDRLLTFWMKQELISERHLQYISRKTIAWPVCIVLKCRNNWQCDRNFIHGGILTSLIMHIISRTWISPPEAHTATLHDHDMFWWRWWNQRFATWMSPVESAQRIGVCNRSNEDLTVVGGSS